MQTKGHNGGGLPHDDIERGDCVLMLAPSIHDATADACLDLLSFDPPEETNALWVTYTRSPDACFQDWLSRVGGTPANARFVSVGDMERSAASGSVGRADPHNRTVETLSNPGDLTGLGIKLSEVIREWSANDNRTVACFDSVTALLQYADLQTVYKFLHVLTGRFETAGVTAHFHLDPDACDTQTVSTITSLFNTIVEFDDGEWTVRAR